MQKVQREEEREQDGGVFVSSWIMIFALMQEKKSRKMKLQTFIDLFFSIAVATVLVNGALAGPALEPTHDAGTVEATEALQTSHLSANHELLEADSALRAIDTVFLCGSVWEDASAPGRRWSGSSSGTNGSRCARTRHIAWEEETWRKARVRSTAAAAGCGWVEGGRGERRRRCAGAAAGRSDRDDRNGWGGRRASDRSIDTIPNMGLPQALKSLLVD